MILALFRMFPAFRGLERSQREELEDTQKALDLAIRERDEMERDRDRLQVRYDAAEDERARLWERLDVAVAEERRAYQAHVNIAWQKMGGGTPYPDAPALSQASVPKQQAPGPVGRAGRMLPSQIVAARTRDFISSVVKEATKRAG